MTNQYFTNPYNTSVCGFYFTDYADYLEQADNLKDSFGMPVEAFSLEFIDGDNAGLFNLLEVNQVTLKLWTVRIWSGRSRQRRLHFPSQKQDINSILPQKVILLNMIVL